MISIALAAFLLQEPVTANVVAAAAAAVEEDRDSDDRAADIVCKRTLVDSIRPGERNRTKKVCKPREMWKKSN